MYDFLPFSPLCFCVLAIYMCTFSVILKICIFYQVSYCVNLFLHFLNVYFLSFSTMCIFYHMLCCSFAVLPFNGLIFSILPFAMLCIFNTILMCDNSTIFSSVPLCSVIIYVYIFCHFYMAVFSTNLINVPICSCIFPMCNFFHFLVCVFSIIYCVGPLPFCHLMFSNFCSVFFHWCSFSQFLVCVFSII